MINFGCVVCRGSGISLSAIQLIILWIEERGLDTGGLGVVSPLPCCIIFENVRKFWQIYLEVRALEKLFSLLSIKRTTVDSFLSRKYMNKSFTLNFCV